MIATRLKKSHTTLFGAGYEISGGGHTRPYYYKDRRGVELEMYQAFGQAVDGMFYGKDLYIFGTDIYSYNSHLYNIACHWKNGIRNLSPSESAGQESNCYNGQIINGDIYMFGWRYITALDPLSKRACYWKNGIVQWQDSYTGQTSSSGGFIKDTDFYLWGSLKNPNYSHPCYWKNGILTILPLSGQEGGVNHLLVDGDDIYAFGFEYSGTYYRACYWKNGIKVWVGSYGILHTTATDAILKDGVLYIFGYQRSYTNSYHWGCVWIDGVQYTVGNLEDFSNVYSGLIHNNRIYMFGNSGPSASYEERYPAYWIEVNNGGGKTFECYCIKNEFGALEPGLVLKGFVKNQQ